MVDLTYNIEIRQEGTKDLALAFPEDVGSIVEDIFQDKYDTGSAFIEDLEDNKQSLLDAIFSKYDTKKNNFSYCIKDDKLVISVPVIEGQENRLRLSFNQMDLSALMVMGLFMGNYVEIKKSIKPNEPVNLKSAYEHRFAESYLEHGKESIEEMRQFLSGEVNSSQTKYVTLSPHIVNTN
jgi:hypothetical protein